MPKITEVLKHKKNRQIQQQVKYQIYCLDHPSDDDLSKFYYLESETVKGRWYRLVASAFGAVSCSCLHQTRNPYTSCKHMRILDKTIDTTPDKIQTIIKIPSFILQSL